MTRKSLEAKETRRRVSAVQHPKVLVLLHRVLNLPVPENCVIDAGNHTLRNMKQSAKPKQPSAIVVGDWPLQELLQEGRKLPQEATAYKENAYHRHCRTRVL